MREQLIRIDKDGNVIGLYFDDSVLRQLGPIECIRASDVLFDRDLQGWRTYLDGRPVSPAFPTRQGAIDFEVGLMEQRLEKMPEKVEEQFK